MTEPQTRAEWAHSYQERGWSPIPLKENDKAPESTAWQNQTFKPDQIDSIFTERKNIGVVLGIPSGNLIDVDLDDPAAVKTAPTYLTETGTVFGRPGKPNSHFLYIAEGSEEFRRKAFFDTDGTLLLEMRANGHQTMFPASKHPSGEDLGWSIYQEPAVTTLEKLELRAGFTATAAMLGRHWKDWGGKRHDLTLHLAGGLLRAGFTKDTIRQLVKDICTIGNEDDWEDRDKAVQTTFDKFEAGEETTGFRSLVKIINGTMVGKIIEWLKITNNRDDRIAVNLVPDNLNRIGDEAIAGLSKRNDASDRRLFVDLNGTPVSVRVQEDGAATIDRYTEDQFRERVLRDVRFEVPGRTKKEDDEDPKPVERTPSRDVIRNIMSRRDLPFPTLEGITTAPVLAPDGSVRTTPGYDEATRTYFQPKSGVDFSKIVIPESPTPTQLKQSVDLIHELFEDFPFEGPSDLANAFAAFIQQAASHLIQGGMPAFGVEKPVQGSGATKLIASITAPFTGPEGVAPMPPPTNDAEYEKAILSLDRRGERYAFFDNVIQFGSPTAALALTSRTMEIRLLGTNQMVTARTPRFTYITGNNPNYSGDQYRRIVPIRLDPKMSRPWLREDFRHELPAWAWEHSPELIQACLTILKAWIAAGRPAGTATLGSFEIWARTMSGVLDVAGVSGFLGNAESFYERADAEETVWQSVTEAWWEQFGSEPVTVRELTTLAAVADGFAVGMSEKDRKGFGIKLRKQRDRKYGDMKIVVAGQNREKVQTYKIEHDSGEYRPRRKPDVRGGDVIEFQRKQS